MREHSPLMTALAKLATPKQREIHGIPSIRDDRPHLTDKEVADALQEYDGMRRALFPEDGTFSAQETIGETVSHPEARRNTLKHITSFPLIGSCDVQGCGAHVHQTPSGTCCVNGHGGADYTGYAG